MFEHHRKVTGAPECRTCSGPSRRDFLKVGALSTLGLTLGDYFLMQDAMAELLRGRLSLVGPTTAAC